MENLMPPPNGSPEEIQAWNIMMDTMVTFIKASTNLMNTITQKVRYTGDGAGAGNIRDYLSGCEPECEMCKPKPPCGVCVSGAPAVAQPAGPVKSPSANPAPTVEVVVTPPTPEGARTTTDENAASPEGAENAEPSSAAEGNEGVESGVEAQENGAEGEKSAEDTPAPVTPAAATPSPVVAPAAGGTKCTCAAIRAKRITSKKKEPCVCSKEAEAEPPPPPPEPAVQRICGCGPTAGNQAALVQEMVEKLAKAQDEINQLNEEMARLQRMDTSRRTGPHGGPNPARLFKEIMKDAEPQIRPPSRVPTPGSQRSYQPDPAGASACDPCPAASPTGRPQANDPAARIPANLRRRLFQTNSAGESFAPGAANSAGEFSPEEGAYYPLTPPSMRPPYFERTKNFPPEVIKNLFPVNAAEDPNQSPPGSFGEDFSDIPYAGAALPQGYRGCIPCDQYRAPSSLGVPAEISPILPAPGTNPRRILPSPPSGQGLSNRSGLPQYTGGSAPCRRLNARIETPSAGSTGFGSMGSNLQGLNAAPAVPALWQNETYQSLGGSPSMSPSRYSPCPAGSPGCAPPQAAAWVQDGQFRSLGGTVSSAQSSGRSARSPGTSPNTTDSDRVGPYTSRPATMGSSVNSSYYPTSPGTSPNTTDSNRVGPYTSRLATRGSSMNSSYYPTSPDSSGSPFDSTVYREPPPRNQDSSGSPFDSTIYRELAPRNQESPAPQIVMCTLAKQPRSGCDKNCK